MANILDIRRRIRSVINTRQITRAMKMISAARLRRAQERALAARPYAQMLTNVLKSLVSRADIYDEDTGEPLHPLLVRRPEQNVLLIVVTGDKGLAGAFNANILKAATRFLESKRGKNVEIVAVGRKGRDFLRRRFRTAEPRTVEAGTTETGTTENRKANATSESSRGAGFGGKFGEVFGSGSDQPSDITLVGEHVGVLNKIDYSLASEISGRVIARYTHAEIDSVYLVYNEFKSVISQRVVVEQVLPVEHIGVPEIAQASEMELKDKQRAIEAAKGTGVSLRPADTTEIDKAAAQFATAPVDYIYEQSPRELFRSLLPKYVATQIFHALLESVAAEHAARMTAMESATTNAGDMIDSLTLSMNRVRQAKITREIIEIVSGAAAQQ